MVPITVTTTADSGVGSLRQAITDANARNRTVADVVRTWKRADAAAATAFVQASPVLPPELKQRLLR
jgi:hypothetical protein